jgi:hypothetical protein
MKCFIHKLLFFVLRLFQYIYLIQLCATTRSGCMHPIHLCCYEAKLTNLKLKTRPKQLLGSIPLNMVFPAVDVTRFKHASLFRQGV